MIDRSTALLLLAACVGKDDSGAEGALTWYTTCGDPVCSGYGGPFEGVDACDGEVAGAACETEDATCDPVDDCNALLVCATEDPKDQEGGCPISLRRYKRDLEVIGPEARAGLARDLLGTRLYRYRYTWQAPTEEPRLGFLIDDRPSGPAVRPDGTRVDLYGYTSMAVATIQAQQAEIDALKAELASLRARTEALEADHAAAASEGPPGEPRAARARGAGH